MSTETLDKLFLELSQFTSAKTRKEIELEKLLESWRKYALYCYDCSTEKDGMPPMSFEEYLR